VNDVAPVQAVPATREHGSTGRIWYVVFLLTVVNVFNYMDRMALAVLAPAVKKDLALTDAQLGLLVGLAFSLFYAVCGIPIARWADRGIRRNIIALALGTWSVMTALSGAAQNFWHLFLARVGVGAGEAGCLPPAWSILCDYVPLKRRPTIFAIHGFGLYAGMMVGMVLAGWLGQMIGWRWAFVVLGLPGIAIAFIVRFTLREPVRGSLDGGATKEVSPFGQTLVALWQCRTYRALIALYVLNGFVQYGLHQWWPSFYVRVFEFSLSSLGVSLGMAVGAGSGIGILLGGLLASKVAARDIRLPLIFGAVATALALPAALGSLFVPSPYVSMICVLLTSILWGVSNGPVAAALNSVVAPRMRATASALSVVFASVFGFALGPFCVGLLSDLLAPSLGTESLRYALLAPVCVIPLMVVALCAIAKHRPTDLAAVGVSLK
jgi:predicted MFS family arabinose efflux permease